MDILDVLKTNAGLHPEKLAYGYVGKEGELTEQLRYNELHQHVLAVSQLLSAKFPVNARVILLLPAEAAFICSFLGSLHAGLIAVPTPISYSEPGINRILSIMRDCNAAGIITNQKTYKMLFQRKNDASSALQEYDIEWFFTDELNNAPAAPGAIKRHKESVETAYLQYTSGSTSQPKGVMISHVNLTANLRAINNCFGRTADDTSVTWLPHYHDMGLVDGLLSPLFTGGTGFVISPLLFITKPALLLQTISTYQAAVCGGPGFGLDHCLARIPEEQIRELDLSSLRVLYVGAEPIRIATLERFAAATQASGFRKNSLVPAYGLAEATLAVSLHLNGDDLTYQKLSTGKETVACGPPVEFTEVSIVNPANGACLADGEEGEIWVKNKGIAAGYWEKPEVSKATFQAYTSDGKGPYLRTGDLGFMQNGLLFITGRTKELIIIRGVNYYPQDIEEVVSGSHPDIQPNAAAAFSVETEQGEALMIVSEVKRVSETPDDEKVIKTKMAQSVGLAFGLIPHDIVLIAPGKLPKTSSGKIQRLKAREIFAKKTVED
ncbi:acyl-CoA synthetase [Dyadobacter beijingensis]|uniref:Acyl-CoA synthetase n=1 Tax=Dyadobacter beijingensis TaxID=365489 RepID=A0ABQ2IK65_9BACT|nr:fatty acyl-AMP ligase [Dyadobacter beijingensis]GGN10239.1 acyl-CoA synthetase [Dyadobacter beijingensis]